MRAEGTGEAAAVAAWSDGTDPATRLAFLEAVVDATADAVFTIEADGVVSSWNRSAERVFGWHASEVLGALAAEVFPAPLRPTIEWCLGVVASGDRIERFDIEVQRPGGMSTPVSLSLCPVFDADGCFAGAAAVARDLTEQRLAQASLAETEARVQESEALAHVGRWLWDVGSDTVQWSQEIHRIHGIDPWAFGGDLQAHVALVVDRDRQRVLDGLAAAVEQGRPVEAEYDIRRPDGELRHLYARAEPTIGARGVVGLRGVIRDASSTVIAN